MVAYEESLLKAIRSLEYGVHHLGLPNGESYDLDYIKERISHQDDERLFFIGEGFDVAHHYKKFMK